MDKTKKLLFNLLLGMLAFLPFHTAVTVWLGTKYGHLYVWSAWKECLIAVAVILAGYELLGNKKLLNLLWQKTYNKLAAAYILLLSIYVLSQKFSTVSIVGFALNARFILMFLVAQVLASHVTKTNINKLQRAVIAVGAIIALLSVAQVFMLPKDLLMHIGYDGIGINTLGIPPAYHTVASGSDVVRAQATLRGPNVLGAYLLIPFFLLLEKYLRKPNNKKLITILLISFAIFLSHSRSAMIGLFLGLGLQAITTGQVKLLFKKYWITAIVFVVTLVGAIPFIWQTQTFQNVVLHNNPSVLATQSNQGHLKLTILAVKDVIENPLGGGLGSAGPSSAIANEPTIRIAENYFLQIGQEVGWLGMFLFVALQVTVLIALYKIPKNRQALSIFLAMIAITSTNLLLHTWTDEVVALTCWILTGLVVNNTSTAKTTHKKLI